jgi:hypothetical protein
MLLLVTLLPTLSQLPPLPLLLLLVSPLSLLPLPLLSRGLWSLPLHPLLLLLLLLALSSCLHACVSSPPACQCLKRHWCPQRW